MVHTLLKLLPAVFVNVIAILFLTVARAATDDAGCSLWTFVPFTIDGVDNPLYRDDLNNSLGYSHLAAARLAMDHFNARDPSVVPELANEAFSYENCNARFNDTGTGSRVFDTQTKGPQAIRSVFAAITERKEFPCAIAGPQNDRPGSDLSAFAASAEIPLVAYGGMDFRLVSDIFSPYSSRVSGSSISVSSAILSFMYEIGRHEFVTVLYALSDTGLHIKEGVLFDSNIIGSRVETVAYPLLSSLEEFPTSVRNSLAAVKKIGFRTIVTVVAFASEEIPAMADAAEELGMNNGDYVWAFVGTTTLHYFENDPSIVENSNITKLLRGAVVLGDLDGFTSNPLKDRFLSSWRSQNASFVERVNSIVPIDEGSPGYFAGDDNFFQNVDPLAGAGFMYDAVMCIGMGMCSGPTTDAKTESSGFSHLKGVRTVNFVGATGPVDFGGNAFITEGARTVGTLQIGAFNLLPNTKKNSTDRMVLSMILDRVTVNNYLGTWTEVAPFLFANGSPEPPELLRDVPEQNYLDKGVRIFGLTLMATALFVIVSAVLWVFLHRKSQIVRASQPLFLYLLAFGSLVQTMAILMMSYDESYGWSVETLSRACTAVAWLLIMGHIINYGALFTKLWRINKVLQFRRSRVKVKHVVWPTIVIVVLAIIMLSVWTAMEGLEWERNVIDDFTGETIGQCVGDGFDPMFVPAFLLIAIPTVLTIYMAWKTKDVESKYSESSWIFALVMLHVQVLFVSVPVIYIMHDQSTNARYIVYVLLIWVFAMSNMLLIIGPKVFTYYFVKNDTGRTRGGGTGAVRVSGMPSSGSQEKDRLSSAIESAIDSTAEERDVSSSLVEDTNACGTKDSEVKSATESQEEERDVSKTLEEDTKESHPQVSAVESASGSTGEASDVSSGLVEETKEADTDTKDFDLQEGTTETS